MRGLAQHGLDESPLRRDAREEFMEVEKDANSFFQDGFAFSSWADGQVRRILASFA